ncbi:hypothetical protein GIB67_010980 [Kingdonia uniflora]|uniref:TOD1/MUCI70 glycosyltransferase-like domain-containing protein n=1 Tax=Kingdonia uniflora TaxID=39325 RepID=A0A7J7MME9_9MAGN|nr:hypothetical protein GIB67_010980 [Kingdonia uniflora]
MNVHYGFLKRSKPGHGTGFDIDDADLFEMEYCDRIVIASAIFGNYDIIQQLLVKLQRKMFVDEEMEAYMKNFSSLNEKKKIGILRVVIVRNLPYKDARRNGKVPKLLPHRIFPNVRYSIWIDGKLELIELTKATGKYSNASIDNQVEFYKREGLTPYSEAKLPITSDVPEGRMIIKEHIPITNLFTCLWFNEVDRFTSRDQINFSTVRDKIMSKVNWSVNMLMDCKRCNFAVQGYHRDLLEHRAYSLAVLHPPPPPPLNKPVEKSPPLTNEPVGKSTQEAMEKIAKPLPSNPGKRKRKFSSKRHRITGGGIKDRILFKHIFSSIHF